jgi:hypothetical protein
MRQQRKSLWWLRLELVRVRVLEQVLEQVLVQPLALEQVLERVRVLEQVLVQEPKRHRNPSRQWQASSRHHASTGLHRFSKRRLRHCASCQRFGRWRRLQGLRWQKQLPMY